MRKSYQVLPSTTKFFDPSLKKYNTNAIIAIPWRLTNDVSCRPATKTIWVDVTMRALLPFKGIRAYWTLHCHFPETLEITSSNISDHKNWKKNWGHHINFWAMRLSLGYLQGKMSKISDIEKVDSAEQLLDKSYSLSMLLTLISVPYFNKRSVL